MCKAKGPNAVLKGNNIRLKILLLNNESNFRKMHKLIPIWRYKVSWNISYHLFYNPFLQPHNAGTHYGIRERYHLAVLTQEANELQEIIQPYKWKMKVAQFDFFCCCCWEITEKDAFIALLMHLCICRSSYLLRAIHTSVYQIALHIVTYNM